MPLIITIDKLGELKETNIKSDVFDEALLYKKVGLKSNNNFELIQSYNGVLLYGKKSGNKTQLNGFTAPFIVGSLPLFGNLLLILLNPDTGRIGDLSIDTFTKLTGDGGGVKDTATPMPPTPVPAASAVPEETPPPPQQEPSNSSRMIVDGELQEETYI